MAEGKGYYDIFPHWHLFDELVTKRTRGAKVLLLKCHVLFSLRVKGRVLNQAVDKQPNMVLDLGT